MIKALVLWEKEIVASVLGPNLVFLPVYHWPSKRTRAFIFIFIKVKSVEGIFDKVLLGFFCTFFFYQYILTEHVNIKSS